MYFRRRELLAGASLLLLSGQTARARLYNNGRIAWEPNAANPPEPFKPDRGSSFPAPRPRTSGEPPS
jgi:hypothetical protein